MCVCVWVCPYQFCYVAQDLSMFVGLAIVIYTDLLMVLFAKGENRN